MTLPALLGRRHRCLERGHEIDHLGRGRLLGRSDELVTGGLLLDEVQHLLAVGVLEVGRVEGLGVEGPAGRELHRAVDPAKDQSYVLGVLDADQLAGAHFPLGDSTKAQVRAEAAERGFAVAAQPDSHDICFIPDGDTRGWLAGRLGERPGDVLDETGAVVGSHGGAYGYTIGQRRGLRLPQPTGDGRPRYVREVDVVANTVTIAPAELLTAGVIEAESARWCGPPPAGPVRVDAQVRAHGAALPASASADPDTGRVRVELDEPIRGIAPGQSVVLYAGTRVLGSATIVRARPGAPRGIPGPSTGGMQ